MIDKKKAIDYVIDNFEDVGRTGRVTKDRGGRTRFGIAERFHPELTDTGFFDEAKEVAFSEAEPIYDTCYLEHLCLGELNNQQLGNYLLDIAVNMGVTQAVCELQKALAYMGLLTQFQVDNKFGPTTKAAMLAADPLKLLPLLREFRKEYYDQHAVLRGYTPDEYTSYMRRTARMGA